MRRLQLCSSNDRVVVGGLVVASVERREADLIVAVSATVSVSVGGTIVATGGEAVVD